MNKKIATFVIFLLLATDGVLLTMAQAQTDTDVSKALEQLRALRQTQLQRLNTTNQAAPAPAPTTPAEKNGTATQNGVRIPVKEGAQSTSAADLPTLSAEDVINESAFREMMKSIVPLTPEQIVRLKRSVHATELAKQSHPDVPPKPTASSQLVSLAPGTTPPVIRLAKGFVSSLVFLDSSGSEWPIAAFDLGNPDAFDIQWDKSSNTLMVQAKKLYTYGNLAVKLKNLSTPVMLTLVPGQQAVDYRVDLRIQGMGPMAKKLPFGTGLPSSANTLLLSMLDAVAPAGSKKLSVSGGEGMAWLYGDKLYLRTSLTVISPGWLATMASADGTHIYEMQQTPLVLVSERGKVMKLRIEGY